MLNLEKDLIKEFSYISKHISFIGLSGSNNLINPNFSKDFDFVVVLPDLTFFDIYNNLPDSFYKIKIPLYSKINNFSVLGSFLVNNNAIRVEFYKKSIATKILNMEIIDIVRLKNVPKKNKIEVFYNFKGDTLQRKLKVSNNISITKSFISEKGELFWGMHYERLLLSKPFLDNINFLNILNSAKRNFINMANEHRCNKRIFYCEIGKSNIVI